MPPPHFGATGWTANKFGFFTRVRVVRSVVGSANAIVGSFVRASIMLQNSRIVSCLAAKRYAWRKPNWVLVLLCHWFYSLVVLGNCCFWLLAVTRWLFRRFEVNPFFGKIPVLRNSGENREKTAFSWKKRLFGRESFKQLFFIFVISLSRTFRH